MSLMSNILAFPVQPVGQPLRRPALLVRAAIEGQNHWRRERDLRRILRSDHVPAPGHALPRLRAEEDRLNSARQEGDAEYDLHQHVLLMIAILAESQLVPSAGTLRVVG
ncbi:DUF6477 family protein [Paracoccus contaminans]|uniref:Uncharacterized protein n=1 Tax=Paracoccus contaminans TaxID=1945662 RepID=A0A1W6D011_9RHOB|nr:DUF6477 family protein [Paracoccus contaminans]ARJ70473.1 hypothetical protein B0A89_13325 [Paracoccus contaminans]